MGMKKGKMEYNKWKLGKPLSRKEAIICQCYVCCGEDEGGFDCKPLNGCSLYEYMPYRTTKRVNITPEKREKLVAQLAKGRKKMNLASTIPEPPGNQGTEARKQG